MTGKRLPDPEQKRTIRIFTLFAYALLVPIVLAVFFAVSGHQTATALMGVVITVCIAAFYLWAWRSGLFARRR